MIPVRPSRLACAVALAFGFQGASHAALIDYTFAGTVDRQGNLTGYLGKAYVANARVDTTTDAILSYQFTVSDVGTWAGAGGTITNPSPQANLGQQFILAAAAGGFTQIADGLNPNLLNYLGQIVGPSGSFGGYVDGYPTTFDASFGTCDVAFFGFRDSSGDKFFGVRLSSARGTVVSTGTVPEPASAALAAVAGLAALRGLRRRKTTASA